MTAFAVIDKTPAEIWDEEINWATRGLGTDTIQTSAWTVSAADLVITSPPPTIGTPPTSTTVWLSAGTAGNTYLVTNTVVTAGGRTLQESFIVSCIPQRLITT